MTRHFAVAIAAALVAVAVVALAWAIAGWPTAAARGVDAEAFDLESTDIHSTDIVAPVRAPLVMSQGSIGVSATDTDLDPARIAIPAIGVDMPIQALGLAPDGSMALAERADSAAWYKYGGAPGDRRAAALIAAHVSSPIDGVGPFSRLPDLRGGERVTVTMSDGSTRPFVVVRREQISKETVDYGAVTADSDGMLVMVTCGGNWDARSSHYEDNVIVWAASLVP